MKRIHIIVTGQVQGVGYRYYCQVRAVVLGITGFAKNQRDGSVEVEAQGDELALESFIESLKFGPKRATVLHIEREERLLVLPETDFAIG